MVTRGGPFEKKRPVHGDRKGHVTVPHLRIYVVMFIGVSIVALITLRLIDLQIFQRVRLTAMAQREIIKEIVLQPSRGVITDNQGYVLAMDVDLQSLWVNPSQIPPEKISKLALTLSPLVGKDVQTLIQNLSQQNLQWLRVARWLKPSTAEQIHALQEPMLHLVYEPRRIYPQKDFAAFVIGTVNDNGDGILGVESFYNSMLKGITGTLQAEFDSVQNPIAIAPQYNQPAQDGVNLKLTIDSFIQHIAETELKKTVEAHKADGGTIIVMDPRTGALRAMAVWPSFDLNRYYEYPAEIYTRNPVISTLYEPGSTFKMVTVSSGLQARAFTADTKVSDPGIITRFNQQIRNWNAGGNGMIDSGGVLYYSSNVGAASLNELTGAEKFYEMVRAFGFGSITGVDLGGEEQGIVHHPTMPSFNDFFLLTNAYGQGIAVTPLQMVQAAATIANNGVMMKPYVVEQRCWNEKTNNQQSNEEQLESPVRQQRDISGAGEGTQHCETTQPTKVRQVIEPGVAWTVRRMLVHSANHYAPLVWASRTGNFADQWLVPGYEVGAKTGTASIPLPEGGYDPEFVIGSVLGFAPAEDAHYVLLVKIDRPKADAWGLLTSVPAFYRIVEQLMRYDGIPPNAALFSPGQG